MSRKPLDIYTRASAAKARPTTSVITLPGGMWSVGGKVYRSRSDAEAAAERLQTD